VRYGSVLGRLGDDVKITDEGYTQEAGYISYYIDGAESQLRTDNIDNLLHKDFKSLTDLKAIKTPVQECEKGDPLFKVTKNSKWYLVFYIDKEAGKKYTEGRTVKADIAGTSVDVKVVSVREGPKAIRVVLSCKMFFDEFFGERSLDTVVTVASADGLLIRDSSIVERDGQKGVLVKNKIGEIKFKPVAIKADDGTTSVAYADIYVDAEGNFVETIGTYDEIIAEPTPEEIKALDDK
jgi:putative membrane fusion protein